MHLFFRHNFSVISDEFQTSCLEYAHISVVGVSDGDTAIDYHKYLITVTTVISKSLATLKLDQFHFLCDWVKVVRRKFLVILEEIEATDVFLNLFTLTFLTNFAWLVESLQKLIFLIAAFFFEKASRAYYFSGAQIKV